jgi:hypothetical protein
MLSTALCTCFVGRLSILKEGLRFSARTVDTTTIRRPCLCSVVQRAGGWLLLVHRKGSVAGLGIIQEKRDDAGADQPCVGVGVAGDAEAVSEG